MHHAASEEHWDEAYRTRGVDGVSWYQARPAISLELVDELDVSPGTPVVDVGGGASTLAQELVGRGFGDVTVVDLSTAALDAT